MALGHPLPVRRCRRLGRSVLQVAGEEVTNAGEVKDPECHPGWVHHLERDVPVGGALMALHEVLMPVESRKVTWLRSTSTRFTLGAVKASRMASSNAALLAMSTSPLTSRQMTSRAR